MVPEADAVNGSTVTIGLPMTLSPVGANKVMVHVLGAVQAKVNSHDSFAGNPQAQLPMIAFPMLFSPSQVIENVIGEQPSGVTVPVKLG